MRKKLSRVKMYFDCNICIDHLVVIEFLVLGYNFTFYQRPNIIKCLGQILSLS